MPVPDDWKNVVKDPECGPRTDAQNEKAREQSLAIAKQLGRPIAKFTCDECPITDGPQYCPFIYDHYNTDGDCLAIK